MFVAKTYVLISSCVVDLLLCFCICKKQVFHDAAPLNCWLYYWNLYIPLGKQTFQNVNALYLLKYILVQ